MLLGARCETFDLPYAVREGRGNTDRSPAVAAAAVATIAQIAVAAAAAAATACQMMRLTKIYEMFPRYQNEVVSPSIFSFFPNQKANNTKTELNAGARRLFISFFHSSSERVCQTHHQGGRSVLFQ